MSTLDLTKPVSTDAYLSWPTELQANFNSLSYMLDPTFVTGYTGLVNGVKRINSSNGLVEQYNGSAWVTLPMSYLLDTGDTMTGPLVMSNNIAHSWKDSGGTARRVLLQDSGVNFYFGDIDSAVASSVAHVRAVSQINFALNGTGVASITAANGVTSTGNLAFFANAPSTSEGFRVAHSSGFYSGYNTANSTRTGYLQFNAATSVLLFAENGASLQFGVGGSVRYRIDTSGWHSFLTSNSAAATNSSWGGSTTVFGPNAMTATGAAFGIGYNTTLDQAELIALAPGVAWKPFASFGHYFTWAIDGTERMRFDAGSNLLLGSTSSTWAGAGRVCIEVNGTSTALIGLKIGGAAAGYLYHDGSHLNISNNLSGNINFAAGGSNRLVINSNGVTTFNGGAYTSRVALGSQSTITVDWSRSNYFTMTLTANVAAGGWVFTNASDGQTITIKITQDGTGTRTIAANSAIKWPGGTLGVLSTTANAVDIMVLTFDAATGFYYATLAKGFA